MVSTEIFLQGMGVIYFIAFLSLWRELSGLYGSNGIVPIKDKIEMIKRAKFPFFKGPTIFRFNSSDLFLQSTVIVALSLSVVTLFGYLFPLTLLILFLIYLSFMTVGSPFLDFQWDSLLLEMGFYAFIFSLGPSFQKPMIWVFYLLLFRLMFCSGVVKCLAKDNLWRTLKAMSYHFESQPLPNMPAYFMHQMSKRWHAITNIFVVGFELVVPFLIFFGQESRFIAFFLITGFQWLIMFTGNFAFFNLLSCLLAFTLIMNPPSDYNLVALGIALLLGALNIWMILDLFFPQLYPVTLFSHLHRWGILHGYGLFATMTKGRYEIIIEGSFDEEEWTPYEFHYKPQALDIPPAQIAPFQPRLEWQLWFIPTTPWNQVGWFVRLLERLLQGSPSVKGLFKNNPFPLDPPKYVRALLYSYKFTDYKTWRSTGHFWKKEFVGVYTPPIELTSKL